MSALGPLLHARVAAASDAAAVAASTAAAAAVVDATFFGGGAATNEIGSFACLLRVRSLGHLNFLHGPQPRCVCCCSCLLPVVVQFVRCGLMKFSC